MWVIFVRLLLVTGKKLEEIAKGNGRRAARTFRDSAAEVVVEVRSARGTIHHQMERSLRPFNDNPFT
jgi:Sec-independent protein translocase protein TatA